MTNLISICLACVDRVAVACGMISQYNITDTDKKYGIKNLGLVVGKRLKMQGFIVGDPDFGVRVSSVTLFPIRIRASPCAHSWLEKR